MTCHSQHPFSYRSDPDVPGFDDTRPLFVFDGKCALCSGGVRWLMAADPKGAIAYTSAQGELGASLYRHYSIDIDSTYLLIDAGHAYGMSGGYFRLLPRLGGFWRLFWVLAIVPEGLRDAVYRLIARNRYRWFGRREHCALLTSEQRSRLL